MYFCPRGMPLYATLKYCPCGTNSFGKRLKELRLEKGLTQQQLGKTLHVCNQTISFWEIGSREPDLNNLVAIAQYFGVTIDFLLNENAVS